MNAIKKVGGAVSAAKFWSIAFIAIAVFVTGMVVLDRHWDRSDGVRGCFELRRFTGVQTRWVDVSFWDYGCWVTGPIGEARFRNGPIVEAQ